MFQNMSPLKRLIKPTERSTEQKPDMRGSVVGNEALFGFITNEYLKSQPVAVEEVQD